MPYKIRKRGKGFKVTTPNHPQGFSKKPMSKKKALKQLFAIKMHAKESLVRDIAVALAESSRDPTGPRQTFRKGEVVWFEYHCDESDTSQDTHLRDRSHQKVTVLGMEQNDGWASGLKTIDERCAEGCPIAYKVRFPDGLTGTVMEDELSYDRSNWTRPDPPNNRNQGGMWTWHNKRNRMVPSRRKIAESNAQSKPSDLRAVMRGVSLGKDKKGWYVYTHRARSKSYPDPHDIPKKDIDFIESTG